MKSKIDTRRLVLWLVGIMVLSLSLSGVLFVTTGGISFTEEKGRFHKDLDEEKTFNIEGLKEINVDVTSTDINFIPIDGDEIRVHFYGELDAFAANIKEIFDGERKGDTVNIDVRFGGLGLINLKSNLDIYIPKSYSKAIVVESSSSDVMIQNLNIDSFNYRTTSGDLEMDALRVKKSQFSTTSGDIIGKDFSGDLIVDSTSGDLSIDYKDYNNTIEIKTTSGEVEIGFSNNPEFYLEIKTSSGEIVNDIPITMTGKTKENYLEGSTGNSENKLSIKTTSGDVILRSK